MEMSPFRICLIAAVGFAPSALPPAMAQARHTCVDSRIVEALPVFERRMVEEMHTGYRDGACRNDECEFRVEHLANGNYLVKMRARRFAPQANACVTVFMSETAAVFDATGKAIDRWPYCVLMAHEASLAEPAFKPDPIPYRACEAGAP